MTATAAVIMHKEPKIKLQCMHFLRAFSDTRDNKRGMRLNTKLNKQAK